MSPSQFKDESTVFSIVPFGIREFKPGILPGQFDIPACLDDNKPNRLLVGPSTWLVNVENRKEPIRINQPSFEIARSIVQDFLDGQLFINDEAKPGICWMQGNIKLDDFLKKPEYKIIRDSQRKWYILIVKKTEEDWLRYHNYKVVTDQARFAVRALGLETPEWMAIEEIGLKFTKCPACSTMNDPINAICSSCSCVLNEEAYKKLNFARSK